jgi:hypothetical protein
LGNKRLDNRSFFHRYDVIVIIVLVFIAFVIMGLFHLRSDEQAPTQASIIYGGDLIETIYLTDEPRVFSVYQLPQITFSLNPDGVAFIKSDCPDQICVNTGKISQDGQFAACLPNEVLLIIE